MKHLKRFNESIEDLEDISDMFREFADKWNLSELDYYDEDDMPPFGYYTICEVGVSFFDKTKTDNVIQVLFQYEFLSPILRCEKLELKKDIDNFISRLKSIGYKAELDENGFDIHRCYEITIKV